MGSRPSRSILTAIAAVLVVAGTAGIASAAVAADEPDGIGLTVEVTAVPGEPTPVPTDSSSSPGTSGNNNSGNNSGSGTVVTPVDTPNGVSTPKPGEESLGGLLYVSGLSLQGRSSINPAATQAVLEFTVHNVSSTVISGKAAFRVHNVLGAQLGETQTVTLVDLKPDETRMVQATVRDVGQWGLLHGSVVFTPPKEVEGITLSPMTREQYFFVFPWFSSVVVVLGLASLAVVLVVRRAAGIGAALVPRGGPA